MNVRSRHRLSCLHTGLCPVAVLDHLPFFSCNTDVVLAVLVVDEYFLLLLLFSSHCCSGYLCPLVIASFSCRTVLCYSGGHISKVGVSHISSFLMPSSHQMLEPHVV